MVSQILFWIILIIEIAGGISFIYTLAFPNRRIWPPPSKQSWQYYSFQYGYLIGIVSFFLLGIFDWSTSFTFPLVLLSLILGITLIIIGIWLYFWAVKTFSIHKTFGLKGNSIIESGPYKFSRNPQYVSHFIFIVGYMILTSSFLVLITGIIWIILFIITPFTEEPWLKEQYGRVYELYCQKVRRFV